MAHAALKDLGATEIFVISRSGADNYLNIYERHSDASFIINTTPMGMYPNNGFAAIELDRFPFCKGVVDIIFNPSKTKLLLDADRLEIPYINGLPMLVAQALQASMLFTGAIAIDGLNTIEFDIIDRITSDIEFNTKNIILIGMPGCGKSTVGALLASQLSRPFIDIDLEVERRINMSVSDCFAEKGEPAFREAETGVLDEFARKSGLVIATGGGIIKNPLNLPLMRQNGTIVMLRRPLDQLATDGRPISLSCSLEVLQAQRLPIYNKWKDFAIDCSTPSETASAIIDLLKAPPCVPPHI